MRAVRALVVSVVLVVGSPLAPTVEAAPAVSCRAGRVALTFDDGPDPVNTPRLLRVLSRERVPATFYVQGVNVEAHPQIVRSAALRGHAIENHSWDHPQLTHLSDRQVSRQLERTSHAIRRAIGREPSLFRPPYGSTRPRITRIGQHLGLHQELWTVDSRDWSGLSAHRIWSNVLRGVRPHRTNVVLLHDGVRNAPRTIAAVPTIVASLRARGYCFITQDPAQTVAFALGPPSAVAVEHAATSSSARPRVGWALAALVPPIGSRHAHVPSVSSHAA